MRAKSMPETKTQEKKPKELTETDVQLYVESIIVQVEELVPPQILGKVKQISEYIGSKGMTVRDACLLTDFDEEKFKMLVTEYPIISKLIQLKELEYKRDLLSTLSRKARSGDDKLAQWLLERRFPDEYGKIDGRKKGDDGSDQNIFEKAIVFIQQHGDSKPLVSPGNRQLRGEKKTLRKRIIDVLS